MPLTIAFEGVDGSGKSVLVGAADRFFREQGFRTCIVGRNQMMSTAVTAIIEQHSDTMSTAAEVLLRLTRDQYRADYAREVDADVVIFDRFVLSTASMIVAFELDLQVYRGVLSGLVDHVGLHATVMVDAPLDEAWRRVTERDAATFTSKERRGRQFHQRLGELLVDLSGDTALARQVVSVECAAPLNVIEQRLRHALCLMMPRVRDG